MFIYMIIVLKELIIKKAKRLEINNSLNFI